MSALRNGPRLSLQHFILQAEIIKAYRAAVRATRPLPDSATRRETLDWLRGDIERLRYETDLERLRTNISSFNRNLKILIPGLGLTGLTPEHGAKLIGRGGRRTV
ncbi:uncharacterized protein EHS24_000294 [Apiotrichum porosum]|uniref:Complex 1 LYR protein domain-containing protein n=1 Tax=Apiotrichum porosum TaxID=105984 RepID=A0A427Y9L1_9TREE|nr:uncharacterized protein EHS24_000294 [Apiotrichum porosum]RSH87778.1 hypothetical protein EHS24_000294 [Apiotrichum porosum]